MPAPGASAPARPAGTPRVQDLPGPSAGSRSPTTAAAPARAAARGCHRDTTGRRAWRAGGSLRNDRPRDRRPAYPRPSGARCPRSLSADPSGRAPPGRPCTHRAISRASRLVLGDGWPSRAASWHLWPDHRVFVP